MPFKTQKRFIAGAVCPKCGALDKLMIFKHEGKDYRECVACGFEDEMRIAPTQRELVTRVNTTEEVKAEETQVLTLTPSTPKSEH